MKICIGRCSICNSPIYNGDFFYLIQIIKDKLTLKFDRDECLTKWILSKGVKDEPKT